MRSTSKNPARELTLGSLFDGIGGWQLAAIRNGIRPVWSSEIEPFCCEITRKHFPGTEQLGDITALSGADMEPVDIICAGSPCQDLSVAGKREGLRGERSGLFRKSVSILHEMRKATDGRYPRFFVWENVLGAFSSNEHRDFQAVLEEIGPCRVPMPESQKWARAGMARTEACDICWRTLDARYWGVPQRRTRIFLVADFAAGARCSDEIFFEPENVSGSPAAGKGTSYAPATFAAGSHGTAGTATATFSKQRISKYQPDSIASCVASRDYKGPTDLIVETVGAVCARGYKGVGSQYVSEGKCQVQEGLVRRLTPLECERLQGLPDDWTAGGSDVKRYKAIGNGMAQPCADFILSRIVVGTGKGGLPC